MAVFRRLPWRRKRPYAAVTEEERMARYVYLLGTMPADVIERAHAAAFREVPLRRRIEMLEELRPFMSASEREQAAEPELLARLVRRAEQRRAERAAVATLERPTGDVHPDARPDTTATSQYDSRDLMMRVGVMPLIAYHFLASSVVYTYFSVGAGSLALADQPGWVGDLGDPGESAGGYEGAGYDGAGYGDAGGSAGGDFGGGFGGFGGFDGGGGFGG